MYFSLQDLLFTVLCELCIVWMVWSLFITELNCVAKLFTLPLSAKQNCSRRHFYYFYFSLSKKIRLDVSCESIAKRGFTWNIKHNFIRKTIKIYSRLSSAAVVIGALRVKEASVWILIQHGTISISVPVLPELMMIWWHEICTSKV